jgi:hypothetical protein
MKTDELRQEVRELEADIKKLLDKFIERNGACVFEISAEVDMEQVLSGRMMYPNVTVSASIGI